MRFQTSDQTKCTKARPISESLLLKREGEIRGELIGRVPRSCDTRTQFNVI